MFGVLWRQDTVLEVGVPKSRIAQWVGTGVTLALVLAGGVSAAAFRGEILEASGLDRDGGAPTIAPTVFVEATPEPSPTPSGLVQPAPAIAGDGPAPQPRVLDAKLKALDRSKLLTPDDEPAHVAWVVLDVATGETLSSHEREQLLIPASNTKTLTTAAFFHAFDGTERFTTSVTREGDMLTLVGGGDPLLTAEPVEAGSYPEPPSLRALAATTAEVLRDEGADSVRLTWDDSAFEGPAWAPTWPDRYHDQVTPISALWVDEGIVDGVRQPLPAASAAAIFADQLEELGIAVEGDPTAGARRGETIAEVESLPVHTLAEQAMQRSNNSFTEVLGRQLARHTGHPATFDGATAAVEEQLRDLGLWRDGAVLRDTSGLSRENRVTVDMIASANRAIATDARLGNILDGLPTAGVSGTLRDRFFDDVAKPARGVARAKTGTLDGVSSLGGNTLTRDGALVVFAVIENGQVNGWEAKVFEDRLAGVLTGCGC